MATTDPIGDFLTRIRNASKAKHRRVDIPASNLKKAVAQILFEQKFIGTFTMLEDKKQGLIRINLKYQNGRPVINGLRRISKPGIRSYKRSSDMPRVLGGMGISIVSTSKGVMTGAQAKKQNVGGEVLAYVW
ncbi:MAG: 30S ribosomal protein S8 [Ignavibacteria bacterium GWA2_55_11]|nr:MAG: 30S ribosomal protein S8 [Ignavibacteria bacterium GWA2_55_11]OGU43452.1 MAG: 30S ribosomal protein S8 [Ignavibacteria bacterium GWC2_56_12]OGU64984.1 MAG: 30S ribosomal protein S8 [Ignavibacteria bacterium RIFCSPHIGHO2_02_FULL_56_12]OGU71866.1 MAG: 30S ribosomal protein S8 [Ignavibacteria bacterium RIFCSPLOWO2_12_FULL_56_21]OGU74633.1 MAG: 30S ribosomal protein S8 [Ignavibacteria bacterium RIFCSPLOWO2_02_FULL_55_14]HAV24144.1 30S ribosomal protein S8 [Bacteroidota bacterium]